MPRLKSTPSPLTILYRDTWFIAVDKPAGQLVHPADVPAENDAVTMKILRDQIDQKIHAVHRIDRPTSGVLLFATDPDAAVKISAEFENQRVNKIYWAIIDGHPEIENWACREPIQKDEHSPARSAETTFRVMERLDNGLALIEAKPKTGRFHQIRRHLLRAGHPIVGDYRYAGISRSDELGTLLGTGTRMLLQSKSLRFTHPLTGADILIEAPTDLAFQTARAGRH